MKILIISQYFYPENFRINDLAIALKKRGHDVVVLTGLPNYPSGNYYEGYDSKKNCDEIWNDISIFRCKLYPRKKGVLNLIRNYFSFVYQANKKYKQIKDFNFDLIYVFEVSPITVVLPAIKIKKIKKIPIIVNIQDLWPENIIAVTGINNPVINYIINKLVNYIYKYSDVILASSPSFVTKIQERVTNKDKVKYWPQYSVVNKTTEKSSLYNEDYFNVVFTGNIGEAQGIDIAIKAANELRNEKICWHFIGGGRNKDKMEELVKRYNLEKTVKFYGVKPEAEIPKYLNGADAALLILKHNPIFEMTIPAKLQTYLASGVPIIGCVSGESKKIIEESKAGIVSKDISVESLVDTCCRFMQLDKKEIENYKNRAYIYGNQHFNKKSLLDKLEKIMEDLK